MLSHLKNCSFTKNILSTFLKLSLNGLVLCCILLYCFVKFYISVFINFGWQLLDELFLWACGAFRKCVGNSSRVSHLCRSIWQTGCTTWAPCTVQRKVVCTVHCVLWVAHLTLRTCDRWHSAVFTGGYPADTPDTPSEKVVLFFAISTDNCRHFFNLKTSNP